VKLLLHLHHPHSPEYHNTRLQHQNQVVSWQKLSVSISNDSIVFPLVHDRDCFPIQCPGENFSISNIKFIEKTTGSFPTERL
jgi:hypothetical protein